MNFIDVILKEHSKSQKNKIVAYVGNKPDKFAELVSVFLNGPEKVTQRASWPISYCIEAHPELIKPYYKIFLQIVEKPEVHDAVKRNIFRLLQFVKIPKNHQVKAVNLGMKFLMNSKEPVAIRVFAMTVLAQIAKENPALKNELIPYIEDQMPYGTAGFISRGSKILKELKRLKEKV